MAISRFRQIGPDYYSNSGIIGYCYIWSGRAWVNPSPYSFNPYPSTLREYTRCWDETHPGPPWRTGGPLHLLRQKGEHDLFITSGTWTVPNAYKYEGSFYATGLSSFANDMTPLTASTVESYGSTAWKLMRPVQPRASGAVFLGELREFLDLFKISLKGFKALGDNYLNYKFGWTPFIGDLQRFVNTLADIEKTVAFIRKNNGKWLKRSRTISDTVTKVETVMTNGNIYPILPSPFYPASGLSKCSITKVWTDHIWCKAKMKYYIPDLPKDRCEDIFTSPLRRRLFGLDVSPATVWELMPWSWLIDWFTNFGDIFRAISGQSYDNLVAKYAFVMRERRMMAMYDQVQSFRYGESVHLKKQFRCEAKERAEASPFGFGLDEGDLTPSQLAILAALGISRMG